MGRAKPLSHGAGPVDCAGHEFHRTPADATVPIVRVREHAPVARLQSLSASAGLPARSRRGRGADRDDRRGDVGRLDRGAAAARPRDRSLRSPPPDPARGRREHRDLPALPHDRFARAVDLRRAHPARSLRSRALRGTLHRGGGLGAGGSPHRGPRALQRVVDAPDLARRSARRRDPRARFLRRALRRSLRASPRCRS